MTIQEELDKAIAELDSHGYLVEAIDGGHYTITAPAEIITGGEIFLKLAQVRRELYTEELAEKVAEREGLLT